MEMKVCKDCGTAFAVTDEQLAWLEARGFNVFERCEACRTARRETRVIKICRDCGQPFEIGKGELDWLAARGYKPYERCKPCRARRKAGQPPRARMGPIRDIENSLFR